MNFSNALLMYAIIPALTVGIIFIVKRKILWSAPLISTALAFVIYSIELMPTSIITIFTNNEWRSFFILTLILHLVVAVVITAAAYFIAHILNKKR
ncbi:MAG: hypothetical protein IKU13_07690 [Clostridia bacterium]|nr:hypothetical protein [Clostridia bacterium]